MSFKENQENTIKAREEKESLVWQKMINQIGAASENCKWTILRDHEADIFSFIESLPFGWDCVIRSKHAG